MTAQLLHHDTGAGLLHDVALGDVGGDIDARVQAEVGQLMQELRDSRTLAPVSPAAGPGPWRLEISATTAQELTLAFICKASGRNSTVSLPLSPFRRHLADYALICESFYKAAKSGDIHRLEAIDAGRRGVHDDAAADLADMTEGKLRLDKPAARRLFSLLYILSKRQTALF